MPRVWLEAVLLWSWARIVLEVDGARHVPRPVPGRTQAEEWKKLFSNNTPGGVDSAAGGRN